MGRGGSRAVLGTVTSKPQVVSIRELNVIEGEFAVGIHKAVVTDFHEAGGQHVL